MCKASSNRQMTQTTDQFLIEKTLDGDTHAFGQLVDRYKDYIFTISLRILKNREEAEEVTQDTFLKAYNSLANFRGEAKLGTWLYKIAYRKSLDSLRKHKNIPYMDYDVLIADTEMHTVENALESLMTEERKAILKKSIAKLGEEEAAIISLYYFDELSVKEICSITDLSEQNVKVKLYRSRKRLFGFLKQYIQPQISESNGKAV